MGFCLQTAQYGEKRSIDFHPLPTCPPTHAHSFMADHVQAEPGIGSKGKGAGLRVKVKPKETISLSIMAPL